MPKTKNRRSGAANRASAEAARRRAAAGRIGEQPVRPPKTSRLKDLNPPGRWYDQDEWTLPGSRLRKLGPTRTREFLRQADAGSHPDDVANNAHLLEVLIRYADTYGACGLPRAAFTLDRLLRTSTTFLAEAMQSQQMDEDEALATFHEMHARGLLWVDDDGSVWTSLPPGVPSPADTDWRICDQVLIPEALV